MPLQSHVHHREGAARAECWPIHRRVSWSRCCTVCVCVAQCETGVAAEWRQREPREPEWRHLLVCVNPSQDVYEPKPKSKYIECVGALCSAPPLSAAVL